MRYLLPILLVAFTCAAYPQAQAPVVGQPGAPTTRSIEGTVVDAHGAPVPSAVVLLKDTKSLQVRSFLAHNDGKFHFVGLSSDVNYELRAEANGMTSPRKMVSVFDSHRIIKVHLKLKKKLKTS